MYTIWKSNSDPAGTLSNCLGFAIPVVLSILFSYFISVCGKSNSNSLNSSMLLSDNKISWNCNLDDIIGSELPNNLFIHTSSFLISSNSKEEWYLVLANKYLIFPFNDEPGIIGLLVTESLMTIVSTAPIAEKSPDVPICKPVINLIVPFINNFPFNVYINFLLS